MNKPGYKNQLAFAEECATSMKHSFENGLYAPCIIFASYSALACARAFCVSANIMPNHRLGDNLVVKLLASIHRKNKEVQTGVALLRQVVRIKRLDAASDDLPSRHNAEQAKLAAERFLAFVKGRLPAR